MHLSYVLAFLVQAAAFVAAADEPPKVKWTLHKNGDKALRDAILLGMETTKDRAVAASTKVLDTGNEKVQAAVKLLLGGDAEKAKAVSDHRLVDAAKRTGSLRLEQFRLYNGLEGPIGAPSDKNTLTGAIYLDSDAWKAVAKDNDKHYLNFVIYCAPDILEERDEWGNRIWTDFGRQRQFTLGGSTLVQMKTEADNNAWNNPKSKILGLTETDKPGERENGLPRGDLKKIAETITLHPLWLREMKDHAYDLLTAEKLADIKKPSAWRTFLQRLKDAEPEARPIDALMGLEGTLHHETYHLTSFGKLLDTPEGAGAYGWVNNQKTKNIKNPDLLAYLALIIDLVENKSCKINERGEVTPPS
ncbi:hypothetical protein PCL_12615 [Purpureocillium lilacinum]|uniref:Uncharacterized protein n=1 Tax=Purpureocillium lilacinum TaxID=33203 RepID=A0A2U3E9R7_PURLI|nr:hypothetical protein Purlil1_8708 [Purpureocillium lilacinum]PWI71247.1 hypothetical protein PCL_12615 [Purpureocillium lilacinum]